MPQRAEREGRHTAAEGDGRDRWLAALLFRIELSVSHQLRSDRTSVDDKAALRWPRVAKLDDPAALAESICDRIQGDGMLKNENRPRGARARRSRYAE